MRPAIPELRIVHGIRRRGLVDNGPAGERDTYIGTGTDASVYYAGRKTPVRVDLRQDANEDHLVGIRSAAGGGADDVIIGDDQANHLEAYGGHDQLTGGNGDDLLESSREDGDSATMTAGPGNDTLAIGSRRDRVSCGDGVDLLTQIAYVTSAVSVPRDCEQIQYQDALLLRGAPRRRADHIDVTVERVERRGHRVALFAGKRFLGRSRPVRRTGTYRITLNRAGRRVAVPGGLVDVRTTRVEKHGSESVYRYRLATLPPPRG